MTSTVAPQPFSSTATLEEQLAEVASTISTRRARQQEVRDQAAAASTENAEARGALARAIATGEGDVDALHATITRTGHASNQLIVDRALAVLDEEIARLEQRHRAIEAGIANRDLARARERYTAARDTVRSALGVAIAAFATAAGDAPDTLDRTAADVAAAQRQAAFTGKQAHGVTDPVGARAEAETVHWPDDPHVDELLAVLRAATAPAGATRG